MADKLREKQKSEEARYKLGEERQFKVRSRRTKLLGLWAAGRMGMDEAEATDYAIQLVMIGYESPGEKGITDRLLRDFDSRGLSVTESEIHEQAQSLMAVATTQIAEEFPSALGPDHERVGD